jgi:hypothetical protein
MPEGKNAKRNGLSSAAWIGGALPIVRTEQKSPALSGDNGWFWNQVLVLHIYKG